MPDLSQSLWFGVTRWTWIRLAFALIIVLAFVGFLSLRNTANRVDANAKRASYSSCVVGNESRATLVDLLTQSLDSGLDLTAPASFQSLDPPTQQYLKDVQSELGDNGASSSQIHDFITAKLPQRDCGALLK